MDKRYAYSFDRDSFTGSFASRNEALRVAIAKALDLPGTPTTVYVGRLRPADPQASGHAQAIIDSISRRARDRIGMEHYLKDVTPEQVQDLDQMLESAIVGWMKKHDLLPKTDLVETVTEHPVPTDMMNPAVNRPQEQSQQEVFGPMGSEAWSRMS